MAFAELKRVDDPRDKLDRARRPELVKYARANGLSDISADMPAILIRKRLRAANLTRIPIPNRTLGTPGNGGMAVTADSATVSAPATQVDASDDLERQFKSSPAKPPAPVAEMTIGQLRQEAKRLGLKFTPKNKMIELRKMVEDATHIQ